MGSGVLWFSFCTGSGDRGGEGGGGLFFLFVRVVTKVVTGSVLAAQPNNLPGPNREMAFCPQVRNRKPGPSLWWRAPLSRRCASESPISND